MPRKLLWIFACASGILFCDQSTSIAQTMKSAKECNQELAAGRAAIAAAGMSVKDFIDTCWWHTSVGQPTPISRTDTSLDSSPRTAVMQRQVTIKAAVPAAVRRREAKAPAAEPAPERRVQRVAARVSAPEHAVLSDRVRRRKERRFARLADRRDADNRIRRRQASRVARAVAERTASQTILRDQVSQAGVQAREGRRSYVAIVSHLDGPLGQSAAVLLISRDVAARDGLDCWTQPVLFVGRSRRGPRAGMASSLVCDRKRPGSELNLTHLTAYAQISEL